MTLLWKSKQFLAGLEVEPYISTSPELALVERGPLAVLILSSCKAKFSSDCFYAAPRLGKQSLAQTYWGHVRVSVHAYSEEMDAIFHSPSRLEWTLGWNTSPRVLHAAQCEAYLITVKPKGQSNEQTHDMINVIMFHLWLSQTRPMRSDLQTWC